VGGKKDARGVGVRRGEKKRGGEAPLLKNFPLPFAKGKGIKGIGFTNNLSFGACL